MELAVAVLAVADMDRAHDFYEALGWPPDADFPATQSHANDE